MLDDFEVFDIATTGRSTDAAVGPARALLLQQRDRALTHHAPEAELRSDPPVNRAATASRQQGNTERVAGDD